MSVDDRGGGMSQSVRDDLTDPEFHANPHPSYASWRREGPVRPVRLAGGADAWLVTRYEDARRALSDPRLSKVRPGVSLLPDELDRALSSHMLAVDPPDHTRLRR